MDTKTKTASDKNVQFFDQLYKYGTIKDYEICEILKSIDRADFCSSNAYIDSP